MPPLPTVSAVWPLNVAIAAAIEAAHAAGVAGIGAPIDAGDPEADPPIEDGPPALDDPPVYSGQVPEGTPIVSAYVVLSNSQEFGGRGTFRRRGKENIETIDVWTADTSKRTAAIIAGALTKLLSGVDLVLEGYGTVRGRVETPIMLADPGGRLYHAQCRYTVTSLNPTP